MHDKVTEVLIEARKSISRPEDWTQGVFARNSNGASVKPTFWGASCYCSLGALIKASDSLDVDGGLFNAAIFRLARVIDMGKYPAMAAIGEYNDNHTHAEVMKMFDDAIQLGSPYVK